MRGVVGVYSLKFENCETKRKDRLFKGLMYMVIKKKVKRGWTNQEKYRRESGLDITPSFHRGDNTTSACGR